MTDHLSETDRLIREGRADGKSWADLAENLGVTAAWVRKRAQMIGADKIQPNASEHSVPNPAYGRGIGCTGALPAGHPLTWAAISLEPYPFPIQSKG